MADTAVVAAVPAAKAAKTPKKKTAAKKHADHPKYSEMIKTAITSLKERGGSSRQAILKYILKNFKVGTDERTVNNHLKLALRAGANNGTLKQSKGGTGATGSFSLGKEKHEKPKKAKKPKAAAKKAAKPKKAKKASGTKKAAAATGDKKAAVKKAAKPKKAKKAKSPKKPKAAKAKKAKSPKKAKASKKAKAPAKAST